MQALLFLLSGRDRLFFIIKYKNHKNMLSFWKLV